MWRSRRSLRRSAAARPAEMPALGSPEIKAGERNGDETIELSTRTVYETLRAGILRGELDADAPISQVQLARQLGVSRTPLREALRMLQREGLIESEPNRRVRVSRMSLTEVEQLYAMRVMLETRPVSSAYIAPASARLVGVAPGKFAVVNRLLPPVFTGSLTASAKTMPAKNCELLIELFQVLTCVKLSPKFNRCDDRD